MKKVMIFGVNGFSGRHLVEYLASQGGKYHLIGVAKEIDEAENRGLNEYRQVDVSEFQNVRAVIAHFKPDIIINLIGRYGVVTYSELILSNVTVSYNILQSVVENSLQNTRLLFIGSAAEYGIVRKNPIEESAMLAPVSLYGLSKVQQTELVEYFSRVHRVNAVVARMFNLRGRGLSSFLAIGNFQRQIDDASDGDVINVGNLDAQRDYLHIEDAVRYYESLMLNGAPGEVYNVCSGQPIRIGDLLLELIAESGKSIRLNVASNLLRSNDAPVIFGSRKKLDSLLNLGVS